MRVGLVLCHSYPKRVALCLLFKVWGVFHRYPSLGRSWALTFFPPHTPRPPKVQLSVSAFSLELNQQMSSNRSNFECWAYLSEFLSSRGFWCSNFLVYFLQSIIENYLILTKTLVNPYLVFPLVTFHFSSVFSSFLYLVSVVIVITPGH